MAKTGRKDSAGKETTAGKKARLPLLLFVVLASIGAFALIHVIALRVGGGDMYPPYSSLRADPLGSKALYESLETLPGLSVRRLQNSNEALPAGLDGAYLRLGIQSEAPFAMEPTERDALLAFAARGGRVVFAFAPILEAPDWLRDCEPAQPHSLSAMPSLPLPDTPPVNGPASTPAVAPASAPVQQTGEAPAATPAAAPAALPPASPPPACEPQEQDEKPLPGRVPRRSAPGESAAKESPPEAKEASPKKSRQPAHLSRLKSFTADQEGVWGLRLHFMNLQAAAENDGDDIATAGAPGDDPALPKTIPQYSALWFEPRAPEWRVLYSKHKRPVLIERDWGAGKIILLADAYPFSNEAMLQDRQTALLLRLIGPAREIVFAETQLGLHSEPGVVNLIHRYRLDGFLAGLLLLALLYLWKNARGPVPPAIFSEAEAGLVSGRGFAAGLLTLLRRSLPASKILPAALAEWQRHRAASGRAAAALDRSRLALIETTARSGGDPLTSYNRIHDLIHPKNRR